MTTIVPQSKIIQRSRKCTTSRKINAPKASVELICDGLKRCLKEKSFESVTISDIQRVSGVSRSTFYRNFDRIEDVLAPMCDRVFEEAFLSDYANISEAVFRTWFRHQELIETIVGIDRGDMLYASLRRCTSRMRSGLPESGDAALLDYLASIIASSMMGIMITWVERGKKENEEELKGMILQSFKAMKFIGLTKNLRPDGRRFQAVEKLCCKKKDSRAAGSSRGQRPHSKLINSHQKRLIYQAF